MLLASTDPECYENGGDGDEDMLDAYFDCREGSVEMLVDGFENEDEDLFSSVEGGEWASSSLQRRVGSREDMVEDEEEDEEEAMLFLGEEILDSGLGGAEMDCSWWEGSIGRSSWIGEKEYDGLRYEVERAEDCWEMLL